MSGCTCVQATDGLGNRIAYIDPLCSIHGQDSQPLPVGNDFPVVHNLVAEDLAARLAIGVERYGQPLQPFNGRNALRDAYEEALDMCVYLRAALFEQEHPEARP